jgi:chorismate synthase
VNTIGHLFRVTSFGESHGKAIGCVIDGCPAGLKLDLTQIQAAVNKRKTGTQAFASSRQEPDQVEVISGVYQDTTLGSPITILIRNTDAQSSDYDELKQVYRPSHADYVYQEKYGIRDHRGGGRSSVRITVALVAAGAVAAQLLKQFCPVAVRAFVSGIGEVDIPSDADLVWNEIEQNAFRTPHRETSQRIQELVEQTKASGDTLGGRITCHIEALPAGIGEPVFGKLSAALAQSMFSIPTVKGVEFGNGFALSRQKGSEVNDAFTIDNDTIRTKTNFSAGIQGGISNGMPIEMHIAFKPISSIHQTQQTVNQLGEHVEIKINGRHDACAVPRAVPIVEAYTNIVLADYVLLSQLNKLS